MDNRLNNNPTPPAVDMVDLAIIGGGINGCGLARDAAGRGLSVFLCEQGDLGGGTSSASSRLIHGGLRYLELGQFKLVREALRERETLLKTAPHLISPQRFILPHHRGLRPAWLIRLGLLLYDCLGSERSLPRSRFVNLRRGRGASAGAESSLRDEFRRGFEYTDCTTDDARLVIAAAKDARRRGATIATRTKCEAVRRSPDYWEIDLRYDPWRNDSDTDSESASAPATLKAKALVIAAGPWVGQFLADNAEGLQLTPPPAQKKQPRVKLVQGSHIVVKKWYDGDHAYLLQNDDRRVVFVIPCRDSAGGSDGDGGDETEPRVFIGTTEVEYRDDPAKVETTPFEVEYLCAAVRRYFDIELGKADVLHSYSGVRPLYDDGADNLRKISRDYVVQLDANAKLAPVVTIYGGKLTTFRRLAEAVLAKLAPFFPEPSIGPLWTVRAVLSGGADGGAGALAEAFPFLPASLRARYLAAYGSEVFAMLDGVESLEDMGKDFDHGLYEVEVAYLVRREWAMCAEDILWRRTKLGMDFTTRQTTTLKKHLAREFGPAPPPIVEKKTRQAAR